MIRIVTTRLTLFAFVITATVSCANSATAVDEQDAKTVDGQKAQMVDEQKGPFVQSRSSNYFTHDLDATVQFYSEYLGLEEAFRTEITAPKSRTTYGVTDDATITVVGFYPPSVGDQQKGYAGIAFFAVEEKTEPLFDRNVKSTGRASVVLAHRVNNVDEFERRIKKAGVPIISPLGPSATGRSRSMTVVDPNGILIETYQFVKKK